MPTVLRQRLDDVFTVRPWRVDEDGSNAATIVLSYDVAGHRFTEQIGLPTAIDTAGPARALLDLLAVVAGVSYFKAFAPVSIEYDGFALDGPAQAVATAAYDHGLREFAHHNGFAVPFRTAFPEPARLFPESSDGPSARSPSTGRPLLPFGGGKDSSLLASALVDLDPILFTIGTNPYATRVAGALELDLVFGSRTLDPRILRSRELGYLNGHVPVTAVNSLIALIVAVSIRSNAVAMANERSSSIDTIPGINHQFSKSLAFEGLLRDALRAEAPTYFSALRPWSDLAIARAFATRTAMLPHFMSCNRAFVRDPAQRSAGWCGACDKCRSVFLSIAPFVRPEVLIDLFGRNLLDDVDAISGFRRLVEAGDKPFDCVADIDEARQAFWLLDNTPAWHSASVVRAMVDEGHAVEPSSTTFAAGPDHFVPDDLFHRLSEGVFG